MSNTIQVESVYTNVPALTLTFKNWRTLSSGRESCTVEVTDGTESVDLTRYSPGPFARTLEDYADDVLTFIDAGRLDGKPGDEDEYEDIEKANKLWGEKYASPYRDREESED